MPQPRRLGSDAEDRTADYLLGLGWTLLGRRVKLPSGELDVVALDDQILVVVEVKSRSRGSATEVITGVKRKRLIQALQEYLFRHGLPAETPVRIDVVAWDENGLFHFRNAIGEP